MTISITQCVLIGLWTAFCLAGMLFGIYTNRCLIMSAGVGLILGDLPTGLAMGAVGELAFMGFGVSQGGSVPPNPMGPGIVGTIMAITMKDSGIDTGSALALSFPFAVAFQFVITATYTFATTLTGLAYKALDRKDFRGFRLAANATGRLYHWFWRRIQRRRTSEGYFPDSCMAEHRSGYGWKDASCYRFCHDLKRNGKERADPIRTFRLHCNCLYEASCNGRSDPGNSNRAAGIFQCWQKG